MTDFIFVLQLQKKTCGRRNYEVFLYDTQRKTKYPSSVLTCYFLEEIQSAISVMKIK